MGLNATPCPRCGALGWIAPCSSCRDIDADRDRAVLARRKAGDMRHIAAIAGTTEWTPLHPPANLNDGRLPTAALEWPIYVAAYTQSTESCESEGHREYAYGPDDAAIERAESVIERYQAEGR